MSLGPWVKREPGYELPISEQVVYKAFIRSLTEPSRTSPERAILRAAHLTGVSRHRALEIVLKANEGIHPDDRSYP